MNKSTIKLVRDICETINTNDFDEIIISNKYITIIWEDTMRLGFNDEVTEKKGQSKVEIDLEDLEITRTFTVNGLELDVDNDSRISILLTEWAELQ
jgi:hypothetical protein